MRHGSLFSGIGGFDLAAEWMGWENVFHCEWMEFPRKVLDYHFPDADSHIDICKTDFTKYANTIDILTGGFPCQPFSLAGKRKGTDDERYLWGEMLRAIQEIKPRFVIAENVFGITNIDGGLVFEQVCLDLENEGYEVQPFIIPACAKNAPHRRDRCWFIGIYTNTPSIGLHRQKHEQKLGSTRWSKFQFGKSKIKSNATNSNCNGLNERNGKDEINTSQGGEYALGDIDTSHCNGDDAYTECEGLEGHNRERQRCSKHRDHKRVFIGAKSQFAITNTNGIGLRRKGDRIRRSRFNGQKSSPNNWNNFPTQSPICSGDDGIPDKLDGITFPKWRAESIKGYGNAIVPQIAYQLFQIINDL
jgi:DNA (cytosine-5)-methyltransferase 1